MDIADGWANAELCAPLREVSQAPVRMRVFSKLDFASVQELNHAKLRTNAIHFAFKSSDLGEGSDRYWNKCWTC